MGGLLISQLKNQNILIVGAGVTGISCAKVLTDFGAKITILDEKKVNTDYPLITSLDSLTNSEKFHQ